MFSIVSYGIVSRSVAHNWPVGYGCGLLCVCVVNGNVCHQKYIVFETFYWF